MKKLVAFLLISILGMGVVVSVNAAGDAVAGKAKYAVCVGCHGANGDGNKALNSPAVAGQEDWYLVRQLKNYKAGMKNIIMVD